MIYLLAAMFCFISGWLFYNYIVSSKELSTVNIKDSVLIPIFGNINFLFMFMTPMLTMRTFAEERNKFTLDLLLSSRLSETEIILGKYFSTLILTLFILLFSAIFPIILTFSGFNDWGLVLTSYLGIIFSISSYIMVGIFCSSLTDNQIIASLMTFCILLGSMLLVATVNVTNNYILAEMVQYLTIPFHYEGFTKGLLRSYSFVYFGSFFYLFYLLTLKTLQARKW
jgi:ABC-2 type transport system permease protein